MSDQCISEAILEDKPLVTFALFAYNQEMYIREAVEGALAQTYEPLEIILSDDCSTDSTFQIMRNIVSDYRGPHSIILNCNAINMGLISHINKINEMATGELIVVAAGDDISFPERTKTMVDVWILNGKKHNSIHSSVIRISSSGEEDGVWIPPLILKKMTEKELRVSSSIVIGASHAWTKLVVNQFGGILYKDAFEDMVIAFRSHITGGLYYIDTPLVKYRTFTGITAKPSASRKSLAKVWQATSASFFQRMLDCKKIDNHTLARECQSEAIKWKIRASVFNGQWALAFFCAFKNNIIVVFLKAMFNSVRFIPTKYQ